MVGQNNPVQRTQRRHARKKKKMRRFFKFVFIVSLLTFIGFSGYFGFIFYAAKEAANNSYEELNRGKTSEFRTEDVKLTEDPVTLLLMGIENQEGGRGRSDVMILVTVNPETEKIKMLSIPRDTRTYIPEVGYTDKINHSFSYGGADATVEAVSEFLDIPIDYYVSTDFGGFEGIIDELNGITVDVPFSFKQPNTDNQMVYFSEGEMKLDGKEALAYVRMRKQDVNGDFGRNERQKQVIQAMLDKGLSFGSITKVDNIISHLGNHVKTNISMGEMLGFARLYQDISNSNVEELKIEGNNEYIDNIYYFIPEEDSLKQVISKLNETLQLNRQTAENVEEKGI